VLLTPENRVLFLNGIFLQKKKTSTALRVMESL